MVEELDSSVTAIKAGGTFGNLANWVSGRVGDAGQK